MIRRSVALPPARSPSAATSAIALSIPSHDWTSCPPHDALAARPAGDA